MKKFYLTKNGLEKMKQEFLNLKNQKQNLGSFENRFNELKNILENAIMIKSPTKKKRHIIDLGAQVAIEGNGLSQEFILVGSLEADPSLGKISNESPLGRALLGHQTGDRIGLVEPKKIVYKIKKVRYLSRTFCV